MHFIFWDWNGTLVDDASVLWRAFNDTAVPRGGAPVSFERYREMYRHPIREMYSEVGVDLTKHSFDAIASDWHNHYSRLVLSMQLHQDALGVLARFKIEGRRQMVVSALPHNFLVPQVHQFGVGHFFERIAGLPDQLAHSKVEQAVSLAAQLGVKGSDITVIGDSSHDAEVAQELRAGCVLVSRGAESRRRLEVHGYQVIDALSDIHTVPSLMRVSAMSVG